MSSPDAIDPAEGSAAPPVLLAPKWSWWCARRTHNQFDPTIASDRNHEYSPEVRARLEAGSAHRTAIQEAFASAMATTGKIFLDLTDIGLSPQDLITTTVEAMNHGVAVIAGGRLPNDASGGRQGMPALLICQGQQQTTGTFGYWPGAIKAHKTVWRTCGERPLVFSTLDRPGHDHARTDDQCQPRLRENDSIELAHYWRMLQASGFAATGAPLGAIIGSDRNDYQPVLVWYRLDDPAFRTFSRSRPEGFAIRTALERHDHEHDRRLRIAAVAIAQRGQDSDPEPLVEPVMVRECVQCPWESVCAAALGPDDPSVSVGNLDAREWLALRALGVTTTADLATLVAEDVLADYLPEVGHQERAAARLEAAIVRAQMVSVGEYLRRVTVGPIDVPRADIEIDLDIESDRNGRVYLWGLLISDRSGRSPSFVGISDWRPLNDQRESELGAELWQFLRTTITDHERSGRSVLVYHYSTPEPMHLLKLARGGIAPGLPSEKQARTLIRDHFVDLLPIMRTNFLGLRGLGLKMAASHGPRFRWRDDDPGGAQSQTWLDEVYQDQDPSRRDGAKVRILEYNEDDVRATSALRHWLAELD
ncbi:MAG: TM0106 family RecB-like putative nuclease [Actinomycetes bacterium]